MKNLVTFNTIKEEFGEEVAINSTILISINKSLSPTNEEMISVNGIYTKRLMDQFDNVLWELDDEVKELVIKVWRSWHTFECCHALNGLGGCTKKSLREIIYD